MLLGAAAVLSTSCSQDAPWGVGNGEGEIHLHLSADRDVTAAVPSVRAVSTDIVAPPVAEFQVKVSKIDGSYSESFSTVADFVKKGSFLQGHIRLRLGMGNLIAKALLRQTKRIMRMPITMASLQILQCWRGSLQKCS